jgi:hypothetical protein
MMRKVSAVVNAVQAINVEIANFVAKKSQKRLDLCRQTISCRCAGHTVLRLNGNKSAAKKLLPTGCALSEIFC